MNNPIENVSRRDFIKIAGAGGLALLADAACKRFGIKLPSETPLPTASAPPSDTTIETTTPSPTHIATSTPSPTETPTNVFPIGTHRPIDTVTRVPTETQTLIPTVTKDPYLTYPRFTSEVIGRVETERNEYAITIDDGWYAEAFSNMLTLLKQSNARATFFLIGRAAEYVLKADLLKQALHEGHEFGYHSTKHPEPAAINKMTTSDWKEDYRAWCEEMEWILGKDLYRSGVKPIARAPYELFTKEFLSMCHEFGLVPVAWNTDSKKVSQNVPSKGDIILLHIIPDDIKPLKNVLGDSSLKGITFSQLITK